MMTGCPRHQAGGTQATSTAECICPPQTEIDATDVTKQPGEGVTAFSVRRIQHDAWKEGHDSGCVLSLHPCWHHPSPYGDPTFPPGTRGDRTCVCAPGGPCLGDGMGRTECPACTSLADDDACIADPDVEPEMFTEFGRILPPGEPS